MTDIEILTGFHPGAIGRMVELHGRYYAQHWGFGTYFEAMEADELARFAKRYDPDKDSVILAQSGGQLVGSVAIDGIEDGPENARLRWFILDEAMQGKGIGKKLLDAAMTFVDTKGYTRVVLDTIEGLDAACGLYEKYGFRQTKRRLNDTVYGPPINSLEYVWHRGAFQD